jgi:endonuclease/exonuclease/phosphatase (EEP) superfamily protein YafD
MAEEPSPAPHRLIRLLLAVRNLFQAFILLYGLAVTGYLLARLAAGERWSWIAYANNFVPWWALGNLALGAIALSTRRRWLLVTVQIPGMAAFLILYGELLLPRDTSAEATDHPPITVATYNIISATSDPQRVREVITGLDADLIGLQEVGQVHAGMFAAELSAQYPYQAMYPGPPVSGVGLLSRYPILQEEMFQPLAGSMYYLRAVIDLDGLPVTVYVIHPLPPQGIISPFMYDDARRDSEIAILRDEYLAHETGPLLVVGDFNMTDQSDSYRRMDDLLEDTFREVGRGMGFTFPDQIRSSIRLFPLLLRIDYIWHTADFAAHSVHVGDDSGTSDHRPVVARLVLLD